MLVCCFVVVDFVCVWLLCLCVISNVWFNGFCFDRSCLCVLCVFSMVVDMCAVVDVCVFMGVLILVL